MRQHALIASLLLVACGDKTDDGPIFVGETGDTYVPWPDDTAAGTDEDGDGFTVEDGDCDDADVYVNPGWPENEAEGNAADGKDNDCDGYVDESFRGLVVLQQGDGKDPARIVGVDDFGETDWEVLLDDATLIPYFMAPGLEGGWLIGTLGSHDGAAEVTIALYAVSPEGDTTLLWDLSDPEVYEFGLGGVAAHPDGYYLVCTGDTVSALEPDGSSLTPLMTSDPEADFFSFDVAVDGVTGEIGVFGLYGEFALISPEGAVEVLRPLDPENIEYSVWSGIKRADGWYAGGNSASGWQVMRFNLSQNDWAQKISFDEEWTPHFLETDDVNGGFFVSSTDATYPIVWRLSEDDGSAAPFFRSPYEDFDYQLWDLYTRY